DAGVARFMEQGGSVLLLAGSPTDIDPEIAARTGIRVRDRRARLDARTKEKNPWEGDWISNFNWIKHEPLFDHIPRTVDSPLSGDLGSSRFRAQKDALESRRAPAPRNAGKTRVQEGAAEKETAPAVEGG